MIDIQQLSLPYALKNVSCHLPKGKLIGIMGANGAGKTTLLKAIAGLIPTQRGVITIDGEDLASMDYRQRGVKIAYLPQQTKTYWQMSVFEVIALGLSVALKKEETAEKVHAAADYFSVSHLLKQPIQTLSGGEAARVHLARCCIKEAPILLADEPIAALDPYYQIDMMQHLKNLTPRVSCVVVLHHLSLAYRYCDEIILLKNGEIIASGATKSVLITENLASALAISATIDPNTNSIHTIQKE